MKLILISVTMFLIFTTSGFSELTVDDLDKIRSIVKESETGMKEHIDDKVKEIDKRLNLIFGFVIALISFIALVVGIPQIIMAWQGREQKAQAEKIEKLEQQIGTIVEQIKAGKPVVG